MGSIRNGKGVAPRREIPTGEKEPQGRGGGLLLKRETEHLNIINIINIINCYRFFAPTL